MKRPFSRIFPMLRRAVRLKRYLMLMRYRRVLPLNELFNDRWEKAKFLGFGKGSNIYDSSLVFGDVQVGENTWIGPFTVLDGSGGLKIGSFCSISSGVHIYSHNTIAWALSGGKEKYTRNAVQIGDNCFVGPQSIIQCGVRIGNNCLIAANSFVNKDVDDFQIVGGSPARVIGSVNVREEGKVDLIFSSLSRVKNFSDNQNPSQDSSEM